MKPATRIDQMLTMVVLLVLIVGCLLVLQPFLSALAWAVILCTTTWPAYVWLRARLAPREWLAALIMVLSQSSPGSGGTLIVTPLELLDRLAALVPPPRVHRHRYYGVLAPNAPLRRAVTAMAIAPPPPAALPHRPPGAEPAPRRAARYAWARLLARIYEVLPLRCPLCGA